MRHCAHCAKDVHNLSMMSAAEATAVVEAARANGGSCLRFYRRADGTVLTEDCPVGVRRRFWRRTTGLAAVGLLACIGVAAYAQLLCHVRSAEVPQSAAMGGFH